LFNAASVGEVTIEGKEVPYGKESSVGFYAPIPAEFFIDPEIIHWRGRDGDIVPAKWWDFGRNFRERDRRSSYREPRIKRSDFKQLMRKFGKSAALAGGGKYTAKGEADATSHIADMLEQNPDLKRADAIAACKPFGVSGRGFQSRVWPDARIAAGLPRLARHGRKRKNRST
jgi:hypothetical protein